MQVGVQPAATRARRTVSATSSGRARTSQAGKRRIRSPLVQTSFCRRMSVRPLPGVHVVRAVDLHLHPPLPPVRVQPAVTAGRVDPLLLQIRERAADAGGRGAGSRSRRAPARRRRCHRRSVGSGAGVVPGAERRAPPATPRAAPGVAGNRRPAPTAPRPRRPPTPPRPPAPWPSWCAADGRVGDAIPGAPTCDAPAPQACRSGGDAGRSARHGGRPAPARAAARARSPRTPASAGGGRPGQHRPRSGCQHRDPELLVAAQATVTGQQDAAADRPPPTGADAAAHRPLAEQAGHLRGGQHARLLEGEPVECVSVIGGQHPNSFHVGKPPHHQILDSFRYALTETVQDLRVGGS